MKKFARGLLYIVAAAHIIMLFLLLFSCAGSKPAPGIDKVGNEKFNLEIGESFQFPNGDLITRVSVDSVIHVPKPERKEAKPFINIQTYKDKRVDKSRENSDDITLKEKTAKVVDKSKDKSKENSNNKHKEKSGLPWWIWLIIVVIILGWIFWKWIKMQIPFK